MSTNAEELAEKLRAEGQKNREFFVSLGETDWGVQVYSDGAGWTARDILIHVTETEEDILRLMRRIVAGGEGVAPDFDIDAFNARRVGSAEERPLVDWLAEYGQRRAATAEFVAGLAEADLKTRGRHPFLGDAEVEEMIKLMYLHVQLHIRDVKRALNAA